MVTTNQKHHILKVDRSSRVGAGSLEALLLSDAADEMSLGMITGDDSADDRSLVTATGDDKGKVSIPVDIVLGQ